MPDEFPFTHVAVFGLGLLGGSLCKAVRRVSPSTYLSAWGRNAEHLFPALHDGTVDRAGLIGEADLRGVDCVVVSSTVVSSISLLKTILDKEDLDKNAVVIDVGSVKEAILKSVSMHARFHQFIGCHPMTGSEKQGYASARSDLYDESIVIITPHDKNSTRDIERTEALWRKLGAKTVRLDAALHDRIVARTSHLPHMSACALVDLVAELGNKLGLKQVGYGIGKGFKDSTRIAAGSEEVWSEIAMLNAENIVSAIDDLVDRLLELKRMILLSGREKERLNEYLARMRRYREEIG